MLKGCYVYPKFMHSLPPNTLAYAFNNLLPYHVSTFSNPPPPPPFYQILNFKKIILLFSCRERDFHWLSPFPWFPTVTLQPNAPEGWTFLSAHVEAPWPWLKFKPRSGCLAISFCEIHGFRGWFYLIFCHFFRVFYPHFGDFSGSKFLLTHKIKFLHYNFPVSIFRHLR